MRGRPLVAGTPRLRAACRLRDSLPDAVDFAPPGGPLPPPGAAETGAALCGAAAEAVRHVGRAAVAHPPPLAVPGSPARRLPGGVRQRPDERLPLAASRLRQRADKVPAIIPAPLAELLGRIPRVAAHTLGVAREAGARRAAACQGPSVLRRPRLPPEPTPPGGRRTWPSGQTRATMKPPHTTFVCWLEPHTRRFAQAPGLGRCHHRILQRIFRLEMRQLIDSKRQHRKA
jgi:hypothetical protein